MADNRTKEQRSYNMSRIRSKNTKPEILVRKHLYSQGFRFRLHSSKLKGRPDIILAKFKTVVFIHGCYWHGHKNCKNAKVPVSNRNFWIQKILTNKKRDRLNASFLRREGWKVITLWECQLAKQKKDRTLTTMIKKILAKK
jgi:DNA mismatch endonuclease, patch repair protein